MLGVEDFAFLPLFALAVLCVRLWRHIFSYLPLDSYFESQLAQRQTSARRARLAHATCSGTYGRSARVSSGAPERSAGAGRASLRRGPYRPTDRASEPTGSARKHSAGPPATSDSSDGAAALRQDPVDLPAPTGLIRYRVRVFKNYLALKNPIPITNDTLRATVAWW